MTYDPQKTEELSVESDTGEVMVPGKGWDLIKKKSGQLSREAGNVEKSVAGDDILQGSEGRSSSTRGFWRGQCRRPETQEQVIMKLLQLMVGCFCCCLFFHYPI